MSTEIRSLFVNSPAVLTIRPVDRHPGDILVCADDPSHSAAVAVSRADFLAAVETECGVRMVPTDAIVIDRAELPEVAVGFDGRLTIDNRNFWLDRNGKDWNQPRAGRRTSLLHLALAEYLDAHPPVPPVSDEDVETLAEVLAHVAPGIRGPDVGVIARRLLATGHVSVTHE